jgi:hypothetical protein
MAGDETTHDPARIEDRFLGLSRDTAGGAAAETTGLARVLVQMDAVALAEDIANLALDAARAATSPQDGAYSYVIRVVTNRAVLAGVDVNRLLEAQLARLAARIDQYPLSARGPRKAKEAPEALPTAVLPPDVGIQTLGPTRTSVERNHQIGGEVSVHDLGFELDVAHHLTRKTRSDERLVVEVDGLTPIQGPSKILDRIWGLTSLSEERLVPALAGEALGLAQADARANAARDSIRTLNGEILDLTMRVPEARRRSALVRQRTERRRKLEDALPELEAAVTEARNRYELGCALREDIDTFVATALTPQRPGARPPALDAASVEELVGPSGRALPTYVLYTRLIAGGINQAIEPRSGSDQFRALAGASAEFALLGSRGRLLTSGVRSVLQTSTMRLDNPRSFHQDRPDYVRLDRVGSE